MDINNLWSGYDLSSKKQNSRCLAVNTILEGKYLVGPVLGQGGFGITYVGYDLNMEAKIAIKEYFPVELVSRDTTTMHGDRVLSLSGEKSVTYKAGLKKYVAEAQNVSQFSEIPGVVSVKDFFYANETAYIVMEFIDGISLKDYLKEKGGCLTEEETLVIMKPILEALVQVHKSGIIHRDISPDNIMLTFEGSGHGKIKSVKLIDFGAARMTAKNDQKSLTIILKHGYAPEEQYRTHGEQGSWTDVYALCAVLYRMLTGETPVPAMDRMFKDELKTLEQCGAKISANTSAAILKGLAVKKEDRIQNVSELISALYEGAKVKPATSIKSTALSGKRNSWIIGMGVVCALAVLAAVLLLSGGKKKDVSVPVQENIVDTDKEMDFSDEEKLGEQIAFYYPMRSASSSQTGSHVLFCKEDGTVIARGANNEGQCEVDGWDHVVAVEAGKNCSFGLRSDGTVLYAGDEFRGYEQAALWTNIVDIHTTNFAVVGLKKDGTIVAAGDRESAEKIIQDTKEWDNISAIACWVDSVFALTEEGNVVCSDDRLKEEISGWTDVKNIDCWMGTVFGFRENGSTRVASVDWENTTKYVLNPQRSQSDTLEEALIFYERSSGVKADGTIYAAYGAPKETQNWSNLQAFINVDDAVYFGFQKDGTLLEYFDCDGTDSPEEMKNLQWIQTVSVGAYGMDSLCAITKNGDVYTYGELEKREGLLSYNGELKWYNGHAALYEDGTALIELNSDGKIETFNDVEQIVEMMWDNWTGQEYCWTYVLLMKDGTVKRCLNIPSDMDDSEIDIRAGYEKYADVETWTGIDQIIGCGEWHVYGIRKDGSLVYAGPEEYFREMLPELNVNGEQYCQIEASDEGSHFLLTADGKLIMGICSSGDVGAGMAGAEAWENIIQFDLSEEHLVALQKDGQVKAVGSNRCGQCDVEEWKNVVYVTTGKNCTLGITEDGALLIAGSLY